MRDRDLAEDLVQETLLATIRSKHRLPAMSPRTWLIGILRQKIVDHIRRASRERRETVADEGAEREDAVFDAHGIWRRATRRRWIREAIAGSRR